MLDLMHGDELRDAAVLLVTGVADDSKPQWMCGISPMMHRPQARAACCIFCKGNNANLWLMGPEPGVVAHSKAWPTCCIWRMPMDGLGRPSAG